MFVNFKVISLVLALVASGIYSFVTPNTIADSPVVYKTSLVFGYDVTGIIFEVNENDPTLVDAIIFHIAPSIGSAQARYVKIQTKIDGPWTECMLVDDALPARVATCTIESLTAEDVTALKVVAR